MPPPVKPSRSEKARPAATGGPLHLSGSREETALTEFEQALICGAEAFYRFAGGLLGPAARGQNLSGQDCVILQQLVAARAPRRVAELMRFANRDDSANVQYALRKLMRAGLVEQVRGASRRETAYAVTEEGARASARLVAQRRALLLEPLRRYGLAERDLPALTEALGLLTGLYDHGARTLAARNERALPDAQEGTGETP